MYSTYVTHISKGIAHSYVAHISVGIAHISHAWVNLATVAAVADPQKISRPANAGLLYNHNSVAVFRVSG